MDPRYSAQDLVRCIDCEDPASLFCHSCLNYFCPDHGDQHASQVGFFMHDVTDIMYRYWRQCSHHPGFKCTIRCPGCNSNICEKCTSRLHKNHYISGFSAAVTRQTGINFNILRFLYSYAHCI